VRAHCPSAQTLRLISNKWAVEILFALAEHPTTRFADLRRSLGRITAKELTRQLRKLESVGLINRRVYAEVPPRVEYGLLPMGRSLLAPLEGLGRWSEGWSQELSGR
jgi:DNA-binding HxlR family transcriptional regulator